MEEEANTSTALGAGGKFRKAPARTPPSTPYARPPTSERRGGGWLSKIMDPAYRIAGGATKIFPSVRSFFSQSHALPPPLQTNDRDEEELEINAEGSAKSSSNSPSTHTKGTCSAEIPSRLKIISNQNVLEQDKVKAFHDDTDISRIEQLMKGKTFSREEVNHLMSILKSRADVEWEDIPRTGCREETEQILLANAILRTPVGGNQEKIDSPIIGSILQKSDVPDQVGASPIDIARAYMGGLNLELGRDQCGILLKDERAEKLIAEPGPKSFLPSSAPKPSICWPGALVQDHHVYATPQNEHLRYRLHDFPRTPYSRTTLSKYRTTPTQSQADIPSLHTLSTSARSRPFFSGQLKWRNDHADMTGSVGPIRHMRNKFASEFRPRGSIFLRPSKDVPSEMEKPNLSKGFLPSSEKNLEAGETSGISKDRARNNVGVASKQGLPSTSQAVRTILEHLDRIQPTPKEKAAELKWATAWRNAPTQALAKILEENMSSLNPGDVNSSKSTGLFGQKFPDLSNSVNNNSNYSLKSDDKGMKAAKGPVDENANASIMLAGDSSKLLSPNAGSFGLVGVSELQVNNLRQKPFVSTSNGQEGGGTHLFRADVGNGQDLKSNHLTGSDLSKKQLPHFSSSKPSLPSISISKPSLSAAASNNGPGFSFPVSAASGVLSEPPTPSIMPFNSPNIPSQQNNELAVPSYSFGANKSTARLVFSFPSTSNRNTDVSDPKFTFGNGKTSLSFGAVGKDAICY